MMPGILSTKSLTPPPYPLVSWKPLRMSQRRVVSAAEAANRARTLGPTDRLLVGGVDFGLQERAAWRNPNGGFVLCVLRFVLFVLVYAWCLVFGAFDADLQCLRVCTGSSIEFKRGISHGSS